MSQRIRGAEVTIRISVDSETQEGSFFKVTEFTSTPRTDLVEEDFLGELESDLDIQHHGWDFSFTIQNEDQAPLEFLSTIVDREQNQESHPDITMTVIYAYREPGASNRVEVYHDVFLKVNEQGFAGRKEYVTTGFEGKCKRRSLLSA
jgi:hypothetical protein